MKTQKINAVKSTAKIILLAVLLSIVACASKESSAQKNSPSAQSEVKPPQIDIHTAVVTGNLDALKQHIAAGTDLNEREPFGGSSPLISAAVFGKTEEAKILIEAGADLNFQNNDGSTALLSAAFFGRPEIVQMLLDNGADKTIKNKYGATAYETVVIPFSEVKSTYDMMGKMLEPMGMKLDYAYLEKTRPELAAKLK